jgi:hypothetical protein
MKQETLEEVASRLYPLRNTFLERFKDLEQKIFIEGAKWQQQNSYNEEDVKNAFLNGWQLRDSDLPFVKAKKKWFKTFKK